MIEFVQSYSRSGLYSSTSNWSIVSDS